MILFFNRKEVRVTRELDELNRVRECLEKGGIECTTRTNSITNTGRSHGFPNIKAAAAYEYRIYVYKKDYKRAISVLQRS